MIAHCSLLTFSFGESSAIMNNISGQEILVLRVCLLLDSPLPIKAVTSNREYPNSSAREYLAPGSAREYLDQVVGNKGSHLTYYFYPQAHIPTMAKIKGCKRNKRNTHARQIRMLKQRLSHLKGAYKLQQMSQHGKIKGCLSEYTLPHFLPKTKDDTAHGLNLIYKINSIKGCVVVIYTYVYHTYSRRLTAIQI